MAADTDATEGSTLRFKVKKPNKTGETTTINRAVRYSYKTEDITAKAGEDYTAEDDGKVVFSIGQNRYTDILVPTVNDSDEESDETLKVKLSNPQKFMRRREGGGEWVSTNELPANLSFTGTINDND